MWSKKIFESKQFMAPKHFESKNVGKKKKRFLKYFWSGKFLGPKRFETIKKCLIQKPGQIWPGQMLKTPYIILFK